ncbi:DUF2259 domain-containing protein [Ensifer soli]|uniref:DUF2259 domain-containing protein n=1 Tax=Ciceribacter sp. sgz301302 TaxID=3342379 RepID=UPI0035BAB9A3
MTRPMRTLALLIALAAAPSVAHAGDIASLQPIGFSSDGKVFAFEEYGIQDGSGFGYSNIYVLDTVEDRFMPGAPVRIVIQEEGERGLNRARREARRAAAPIIDAYRLPDHPGRLLAFNPETEVDSAPHALAYDMFPSEGPSGRSTRLALEEKTFPADGPCKDVVESVRGFRLVMTEREGKAAGLVIADDTRVPASRQCPTGYRIGGVMAFDDDTGMTTQVVFVLVKSVGFEGSNGRWIALPVPATPR